MAISTNGTVIARLAGGLYNSVMSNATYLEVASQDPSALANTLYSRDFAKSTDLAVATTLIKNIGLSTVAGLDNWVAAQLTAAGTAGKGAKIVSLLNDFSGMTADTTYGAAATAFNTKVDAALAASQKTGTVEGKFETAGVVAVTNATFTLTSSLDTVVGGAGDDTINATAVNPTTGAAATNLTSGDSIDGGAGTDTLNITMTAANNTSLTGVTVANVEVVNLTGANFQSSGTTSSTLATATATKATAAADLAAKQAAVVTASLNKNATLAVDTLATTATAPGAAATAREDAVVAASTATVASAASKASAAAAVAALTTEADVTAASTTTTALATGTNYTLAELNAAALAAMKGADGVTLITAGNDSVAINARSAILKSVADAVNLAVKSTAGDLATAVQLKAAADAVAALTTETTVTAASTQTTALASGTGYTLAQFNAAALAALKAANGTTLVTAGDDSAAINARSAVLATDAGNLVTYETARGDFTLAQLNAAAAAALLSDTGATLITNGDDGAAIDARASVLDTAAAAVVTAANTAVTTATATDAAAASALTAATTANTAAGAATVSAAQFVGSTQVWLKGTDSNKIAVTGVAATQTIGLDATTGMDSSVTYGATVAAGTIASNAAAGTLTVTGAALKSLAVSGTGSTGLTLVDGSTTDTITTLSVATSGATVVDVAGATALTTVTSTGAGGVSLNGAGVKLATVTSGDGADSIRIATTTIKDDLTTTTVNETVTAAVTTGAGADSVRVATTGAGTTTISTGADGDTVYITGVSTGASTVDTGAGNDTVALNVALSSVPSLTIAGGDGTDTLAIAGGVALTATDYLIMNSALSGFESVKFTSAIAGIDSSKLAIGTVTNYTFNSGDNVITKVGADQKLVLARAAAVTESTTAPMAPTSAATTPTSLTATAVDYKVGTTTPNVATVYGGALDVTASGAAAIALTLNGSSAKVAASSLGGLTTSTTAPAVATTVTIGAAASDVQSLDITLTSARGTTTQAATEHVTTFAAGTITNTAATTYGEHLEALSSLKVSGSGVFTISTGTVAKTLAKLTTIDLSGMVAFADLDILGAQASTTNRSSTAITLNDLVAETVVLGGGKDTISTNSTVGEIDTISGFQLVASTTNALVADTDRSDAINVTGTQTFTKFLNTATTLAASLTAAGANATANLIFHFGGDTYIYIDDATAGLSDLDTVIKIVGTQDIDLLIGVVG